MSLVTPPFSVFGFRPRLYAVSPEKLCYSMVGLLLPDDQVVKCSAGCGRYLGLGTAGGADVADLDQRLGLVVIIVLRLWLILVGDHHHRLHMLGQRGRVQEVGWGLQLKTNAVCEGGMLLNT